MADKAGDILRAFMSRQDTDKARGYSAFFNAWESLAGTDIASHSSIEDIRKGVLIVKVDHPGWMQMIQLNRGKILAAVKKRYHELDIHEIRVVLDKERPGTAKRSVSPSVREEAGAALPEAEPPSPETVAQDEGFSDLMERLKESIDRRYKDLES